MLDSSESTTVRFYYFKQELRFALRQAYRARRSTCPLFGLRTSFLCRCTVVNCGYPSPG
jgi:hypothetical protein